MKYLFALILAASASTAQADCTIDLQEAFLQVQAEAIRTAMPGYRDMLHGLVMHVGGISADNNGSFNPRTWTINLNPDLCSRTPALRLAVIAHEVGHAVAVLEYPELHSQALDGIWLHGGAVEILADVRGARALTAVQSDAVVEEAGSACAEGDDWSCRMVGRWTYARAH